MEIKKKDFIGMPEGMEGFDIKNCSISLSHDTWDDSYSVAIKGFGGFVFVEKHEYDFLLKLFKINENENK